MHKKNKLSVWQLRNTTKALAVLHFYTYKCVTHHHHNVGSASTLTKTLTKYLKQENESRYFHILDDVMVPETEKFRPIHQRTLKQ